jgi:ABC-2 type transport system permease protein
MASDSPIVSNLPAVTLNWASPITIDEEKNAERQVTTLLQSSPVSWTQADTNIQPDFELYPDLGFPVGGEQKAHTLAVSVQGVFESYFRDKPSPLTESETEEETETSSQEPTPTPTPPSSPGTIEVSPETARLVVIGSAEFVDDIVFEISSRLTVDRYVSSLKLMQNAVAWSTEDLDLLNIRSRGTYARVLDPMTEREQSFWEGANYIVALVALIVIGILWNARRRNEQPMELLPPKAIPTSERWNHETT